MKNAKLKSAPVVLLLFLFVFSNTASAQDTDRNPYYFVYTELTSTSPQTHLYSATVLHYHDDSNVKLNPADKIKLQWLEEIKANHQSLVETYSADEILRSTYIWSFATKEKAENEKRSYMAKSRSQEAKITTVSFTFYKD